MSTTPEGPYYIPHSTLLLSLGVPFKGVGVEASPLRYALQLEDAANDAQGGDSAA